jgi:anaerobic ribonucleoside-triphosphate reductase
MDKIGNFLKENELKRTRCVVYTRVMGYHRPIESFNLGKTGEHKERVLFEEEHSMLKKAN